MRVIWIVGGDTSTKRKLERVLSFERTGHEYVVNLATSIDEIPADHIQHPSVVALVDAFHPTYPGFEGLKSLRKAGFVGAVYLFGEPSPDLAVDPFKKHGLTGYFPSFPQADLNFVGGVINAQFYFTGELDLGLFLLPTGRSSSEVIQSFRDFNAFGMKLATFICRFGIDIAQLKKVLMGLCLGHIKTGSGSPLIDQPFSISYGIDPAKVVLAVSTFTRGSTKETLLSDFGEVLNGLKNQKAAPGTLFPELYHVGRASENLVLFGGSAKSSSDGMDPMMLMTALAFPNVEDKRQAPFSVFSFIHVRQTAELNPDAEQERLNNIEPVPEPEAPTVPPPAPVENAAPVGTIQDSDVNDILGDEPLILGDVPTTHGEAPSVASSSHATSTPLPTPESEFPPVPAPPVANPELAAAAQEEIEKLKKRVAMAEAEALRLKEVSQALGLDVRRLMKERRQPTTDKELRDAVVQLEEKLKALVQEKQKALTELDEKKNQINTLQAQVETLRMKAA